MASLAENAQGRRTRWRFALAVLVIAFLLACFFSTPLKKYATHSYSAADLSQDYSLTQVERGHVPGNRLLSDPVTEMVPWLLFNRDELRAGRVPLWDDRNAAGQPHLANYQSAVFSPFSVPFYLLDLKPALLVSAFLKLGVLGLFTFLFLDLLGLGSLACLIGATAFTFSGHNVLLLAYPHAAAVSALPAGLYFAELALRRGENGRGVLGACLGLALTLTIGVLCGQPEPFYFSVLLVALWIATRLAGIAWREWLDRGSARGALWLAVRILLSALIGVALGAPQIMPFLEYLRNSTILVWRSSDQTPLNPFTWLLYAFPDLFGNPARLYHLNYALPPPNFESANTCYLGACAMVVAASAALFVKHVRAARFFVAAALLWFFYAYDFFGVGRLLGNIPTLDLAPLNRSQPIGLFAMSACAAIATHAIATEAVNARWKGALVTLLVGGGAMWFTTVKTWSFFSMLRRSAYAKGMPPGSDAYFPEHMQFIVVSFAVGLAALVALWWTRSKWPQTLLQFAILGVVFLQSGWVMRDYNPTAEDKFVYPTTASIQELKRIAKDEPVVILGSDTLPPHTNSVYGITSLSSYDAMWIRKYDELYRESFGLGGGNWRLVLQTKAKWIRRFGARFVASPGNWVRVDSLCDNVLISGDDLYTTSEILPGGEVVQTIEGHRERLQGIAFQFAIPPRPVHCTLELKLEDIISGSVVATKSVKTDGWVNDRFGRHEELFDFEPLIDARFRPLRVTISSPDASPGNAVAMFGRKDYWYWNAFVRLKQPIHEVIWNIEPSPRRPGHRPHGRLSVAGKALQGGLLMDQAYDLEHWQKLAQIPGFTIAALVDHVARYTTVSRGIATRRIEDDFKLVHEGNLDPHHVVVLSLPGKSAIDSARGRGEIQEPAVEVLRDDPDHALLQVTRETPGYMVLRRVFFPGWEARVNGKRVPLLRADYAFCAVELDAGTSIVDFVYSPASFRIGLWIAALAPLLGGLLLFATRRRGRIVRHAAC